MAYVRILLCLPVLAFAFSFAQPAQGGTPLVTVKYRIENGVKVYRNELSPAQKRAEQKLDQIYLRTQQIQTHHRIVQQNQISQKQARRGAFDKGFKRGFRKGKAVRNTALRRTCLGLTSPKYRNTRRHHNAKLGCRRFYGPRIRIR